MGRGRAPGEASSRGASVGVAVRWVYCRAPPTGRGRGEAPPTAGGGGPPLLPERDNPLRRWVGERSPAGSDVAPFFLHAPPTPPKFLRRVELAGRLLLLWAAGPQPPSPHYLAASRGLGSFVCALGS